MMLLLLNHHAGQEEDLVPGIVTEKVQNLRKFQSLLPFMYLYLISRKKIQNLGEVQILLLLLSLLLVRKKIFYLKGLLLGVDPIPCS